jgi:signal peptidase I
MEGNLLATSELGRLWKNDYLQTVVMILLILAVVFGFWYGMRLALNTEYPMLAVASGSMSLPKDAIDDGWSQPFGRTLHTGDLIIVQGVNVSDIYAAPLNETGRSGDILVFRGTGTDELIVHRAIDKTVIDGQIYFITQGDHNLAPGPYSPTPGQNVIGKVVMRIPWLGHIALYMRNSTGIFIVIALIIVLVIIEFVLPVLTGKKPENDQEEHIEKVPESEGPI